MIHEEIKVYKDVRTSKHSKQANRFDVTDEHKKLLREVRDAYHSRAYITLGGLINKLEIMFKL